MRASIWLNFGTSIEDLKVNTIINFGANLFNIQGVISNFMHKTKSKFCQAYRLNASRNKLKIGRLNIRGVPFGG